MLQYKLIMIFEDNFIYQLIKNSGLPLIFRHDRSIYKQDSEVIDPMHLYIRGCQFALGGYVCGRLLKNKQSHLTFMILGSFLAYFIYSDWKLRNEGKYQQMKTFSSLQFSKQIQTQRKEQQKLQNKPITPYSFVLKPALKSAEYLSIENLVESLPKNYFI